MAQWVIALLMFLTGWVGSADAADQSLSPPPKIERKAAVGYPVQLGEDVLFTVQQPVRSFTAKERADAISRRLLSVARDPFAETAEINVLESDSSSDIVFGDRILMSVLDRDSHPLGRTRQELAQELTEKMRRGIETFREKRSAKSRLIGGLWMLAATIVLIGFVLALRRLVGLSRAKLGEMVDERIGAVRIQSFEIVGAKRVRSFLFLLTRVVFLLVVFMALYAYLYLGLSLFPRTQAYAVTLLEYVLVPLNTLGRAALIHIPNLFFILILILVTRYALRLLRLFFNEIERGAITFKGFYPEWAQPTYRICRWLVVAFVAVVAFPYIPGSDSPAFKGVSIFIGVLFSLGSSSALANLVAGMTLTYRRAFRVGDRVKIGDVVGDVVAMRLQVTHVRTIKNEEITIPNSTIVSSSVINFSALTREKGLILHTNVTIGYDTPWRQVYAMLLLAAKRTAGVLREPPPFVLQLSLDDFFVTYELNVFTDHPQEMANLYSALHENIQDAFNEYGVQIMSPHYRGDPGQAKVVPRDDWHKVPAQPPDGKDRQGR